MKGMFECVRCACQEDINSKYTSCCAKVICTACLTNENICSFFNCPSCIKEINQKNLRCISFLLDLAKKRTISKCSRCRIDNLDTLFHCKTCNGGSTSFGLCRSCSTCIHSVGDYQSHDVKIIQSPKQQIQNTIKGNALYNEINEQRNVESPRRIGGDYQKRVTECEIHVGEKVKKMCSKEKEALCDKCAEEHRKVCFGNIINIDLAHRELQRNLSLWKERIEMETVIVNEDTVRLTGIKNKLQLHAQTARQEIMDSLESLVRIIRTKQSQLLLQLDTIFTQKDNAVCEQMRTLNIKQSRLIQVRDILHAAVDSQQSYKLDLIDAFPFFTVIYKLAVQKKRTHSNSIVNGEETQSFPPLNPHNLSTAQTYLTSLQFLTTGIFIFIFTLTITFPAKIIFNDNIWPLKKLYIFLFKLL